MTTHCNVIVILIIKKVSFLSKTAVVVIVNDIVGYAQTWEVFTLKNPIEGP